MKLMHSFSMLTALVLVLCVLAACHSAPKKTDVGIPFQNLRRGYQSGAREPQCSVITTRDEWAAWWKKHASLTLPPAELPVVDFDKESVLVLSLGNRPTSGYGVEIVRVTESDGKLMVEANETPPAKDTLLPQVITQPYHIVTLPRTSAKPRLVLALH